MSSTKPDYERAQTIIRDAIKQAAIECGFKDAVDVGVVISACQAAFLAEVVPSDLLMKQGGVEHATDVFVDQYRGFVVESLIHRVKHEQRQARH